MQRLLNQDKNAGLNQEDNYIDNLPEYDLEVDEELTARAADINTQFDTAEITLYIQAYKADSPQFSAPWTPSDPNLEFHVKEETVNQVLFKLTATDPLSGQKVQYLNIIALFMLKPAKMVTNVMLGVLNVNKKVIIACLS